MKEYIRLWDTSDELTAVNDAAKDGWRVIASFSDERRGTMFILERERIVTLDNGVQSAEPTRQPFA